MMLPLPDSLPLRDAQATAEVLRPVTDSLQRALDFGNAIANRANDDATEALGAEATASRLAEASITRTFALEYLRLKEPRLSLVMDDIPNDGLRVNLKVCTISIWKSTPAGGIPYPNTRGRRRHVRQQVSFFPEDIPEDVNLVMLYSPRLEAVDLRMALPSGELERGARPWEGTVHCRWEIDLPHVDELVETSSYTDADGDDLPIAHDDEAQRRLDLT